MATKRPTVRRKYGEQLGNQLEMERRGTRQQRGYDKHHERWRKAVLYRDPICTACKRAPATVADHIVPMRAGGSRLDMSNAAGMCASCHGRKSAGERG